MKRTFRSTFRDTGRWSEVCSVTQKTSRVSWRHTILDGLASKRILFFAKPDCDSREAVGSRELTLDEAVARVRSLKKGEHLLALMLDGSTAEILSPEDQSVTNEEIASIFDHQDRQTRVPTILKRSGI